LLGKYKKVIFSEDVPGHIKDKLTLYRNRTAIAYASNCTEYIKSMGLQEIVLECLPASLDEILLLLIKEDTSDENRSDVKVNN